MAYDYGDYKRSVRVKGFYGEVEIRAHDTERKFITRAAPLDEMLEKALAGYKELAKAGEPA